jgi:hypothetical protein
MTNKAKTYLENMDSAITDHLINPESIYSGRAGHLRFAREVGYALNDFSEDDQNDILHSSYSRLYVKHCNLKPVLSAKEWMNEMRKGKERR